VIVTRKNSRLWLMCAILLLGLVRLVLLCFSPALSHDRAAYLDDTRYYYRFSGAALGKGAWLWQEEVPTDNPFHQKVVAAGGQVWIPPVPARMPYRDFAAEYPPLSFAIFLLPRLFTDSVETYHLLFSAFMALFVVATGYVAFQIAATTECRGTPPNTYTHMAVYFWRPTAWTLWICCSGPLLVYRFDIVAVFFVALTALLFLKNRPLWAGIALGAAISVKVWPIFLVLPLVACLPLTKWRQSLMLIAGAAILPLLTHAAVMPWTGLKVLSYFAYHGKRGIHIESFWSPIIALIHPHLKSVSEFGAWHLHADGGKPLTLWVQISYIAMILTNLACIALAFLRIRPAANRQERILPLILLTTTLLILSAKVLSVQYLFWLFPFALLVPTPPRRWAIVAAVAYLLALSLGQYWYPYHFQPIVDLTPSGLALVATRNALLVIVAIAAAVPLLQKQK
jgi:hypothetical protein